MLLPMVEKDSLVPPGLVSFSRSAVYPNGFHRALQFFCKQFCTLLLLFVPANILLPWCVPWWKCSLGIPESPGGAPENTIVFSVFWLLERLLVNFLELIHLLHDQLLPASMWCSLSYLLCGGCSFLPIFVSIFNLEFGQSWTSNSLCCCMGCTESFLPATATLLPAPGMQAIRFCALALATTLLICPMIWTQDEHN